MNDAVHASAERLASALRTASAGLVDREALLEVLLLAAIAGEHVLIIGPPGTAKSEAARRFSAILGGRCFEYLLGRFTEPSEIYGPVDLRRLREGVVETSTAGMLPEAEVAFLDEVFQGSTAILNTLLGILNERTFRRGLVTVNCPLRLCVAASNALPEDPSLAAFADRFLVRQFVGAVADPRLEELLAGGWGLQALPASGSGLLGDLDTLSRAARSVDMAAARPALAECIRALRGAGISLSDRRAVKVQKLMAAAAVLAGRAAPAPADLWVVLLAVPTAEQQALARDVLRERLDASANATLLHASEETAQGPAARATRLVADADELLGAVPGDDEGKRAWRLKLEGVAREIDAGFAPTAMPAALQEARRRVVAALGDGAA